MRQSNTYIIVFTAILTIVVGGLLSGASTILAPYQKKSIELDTKTSILSAVMDIKKGEDVLKIYDERIKSLVVDIQGNEVLVDDKGEPIVAEEVDILKNFKMAPEDRVYPVFKFMDATDSSKVDAYIFPMYGNGLWDKIWGFVALNSDLETIKGTSFSHKSETPGLGARISTPEVQERYEDKSIYSDEGELVSVTMLKGENHENLTENQVDGMSGATLTGKGLNTMLYNYFNYYQPYLKKASN